jgi:hypothetical protein
VSLGARQAAGTVAQRWVAGGLLRLYDRRDERPVTLFMDAGHRPSVPRPRPTGRPDACREPLAQKPSSSAVRKCSILRYRFSRVAQPRIRCFWAVPQRGWRPNHIKSLRWVAEKGFWAGPRTTARNPCCRSYCVSSSTGSGPGAASLAPESPPCRSEGLAVYPCAAPALRNSSAACSGRREL